jgi:predicted lipoprotein
MMTAQMKHRYKYIVYVIVLGFLFWRSCYFERLDKVRQAQEQKAFDPAQFARDFWNNELLRNLDRATDAQTLLDALNTDIEEANKKYGRRLGLAGSYYHMLTGQGKVVSIGEDGVLLSITAPESEPEIMVITRNVYGNAIRDASGLINVSNFPNSRDFNNISQQINRIVMNEVLPAFCQEVKEAATVRFVGAAEIKQDEGLIRPLPVVPILLEIQ